MSAPAAKPKLRKVFVPGAVVLWPNFCVSVGGHVSKMPMNERMGFAGSSCFLACYDTLAALRKDFPHADYTELVLLDPGQPPETSRVDIL